MNARTANLRLLYQGTSAQVEAILKARRTPAALRPHVRREFDRLAVQQAAVRAATNATVRAAKLRTLIRTLTRLIARLQDQPAARGVATLKKLRTQAQAQLTEELQILPKRAPHRRKASVKKKRSDSSGRGTSTGRSAATHGGRGSSTGRGGPGGAGRRGPGPSGELDGSVAETRAAKRNEVEPVLLGVSAPRAVKPSESFIVRLAAYIKSAEAGLEKKLTALAQGKGDVHLGIPPDESARWPVGTPVTVRVSGDGFTAQPAQGRFVWNGSENVVSFVIKAASTLMESSAILSFEVYIEGIRVAFVPIPIEIAAQPAGGEQRVKVSPVRTAFASYASDDRPRVMDKLGALSACDKGLKVFTDCLEMKPGEAWKQRLETEIPSSDLFLLFWSRAARASQYVSWEWRRALDTKGLTAIQPMPLETPKLAPPPPELSSLHFNDLYVIVRDAELAANRPARTGF